MVLRNMLLLLQNTFQIGTWDPLLQHLTYETKYRNDSITTAPQPAEDAEAFKRTALICNSSNLKPASP